MLILLSPAKSLDYETPVPIDLPLSQPAHLKESAQLIAVLKEKTSVEIGELMDLSDTLATLNATRYATWRAKPTAKTVQKQALLAFNGDVYDGLNAKSLTADDLAWANDHLCILSGLYGVLKPLDALQPYRLEMGTTLVTERGSNLYQFWGSKVTDHLNAQLKQQASDVVVNLASQEYFKSVQRKGLNACIIDCAFEDCKNGQYKVISFFAKKARGLMARYAVQNRISDAEALKKFSVDGYKFAAKESTTDKWVFRRKVAA